MSFSGTVSAMISSLKNNARSRISLFEKGNSGKVSKNKNLIITKKASPELLKNIKAEITRQNKIGILKNCIALLISVLILLFLFLLSRHLYFKT